MKKLFTYILITFSLWMNVQGIVFAQTQYNPEEINSKVTQLFSPGKINANSKDPRVNDNLNYVNNLVNKDEKSVISKIIKDVLFIGGSLAVTAIIVASIYYIISMGNEDDMNKAKQIILYTIIGLVLISVAYGIVIGVSKLQFFQ